jgi:hypothetical protein
VRRRGVEQLLLPVDEADAERRVRLVAGGDEEVDRLGLVVRAHVDRHVRRELRAVDGKERAVFVRHPGELAQRRHPSRHVRGAADREQLDALALEELGDVIDVEPALARHAGPDDLAAATERQVVRVVLEVGDHHLPGQMLDRMRDEVAAVRRVRREDDRAGLQVAADEAGAHLERLVEAVGRGPRQRVRSRDARWRSRARGSAHTPRPRSTADACSPRDRDRRNGLSSPSAQRARRPVMPKSARIAFQSR